MPLAPILRHPHFASHLAVLRKLGYIRHVTDGHSFKDGFLYYRFFPDENATYKANFSSKIKPLGILDKEEVRAES